MANLYASNNIIIRQLSFNVPHFKTYGDKFYLNDYEYLKFQTGYAYMNHDAVENGYYVDTTKPSLFKISHVDSANKEMTGKFYATYLKRLGGGGGSALITRPDTIKITDGQFRVKVID